MAMGVDMLVTLENAGYTSTFENCLLLHLHILSWHVLTRSRFEHRTVWSLPPDWPTPPSSCGNPMWLRMTDDPLRHVVALGWGEGSWKTGGLTCKKWNFNEIHKCKAIKRVDTTYQRRNWQITQLQVFATLSGHSGAIRPSSVGSWERKILRIRSNRGKFW